MCDLRLRVWKRETNQSLLSKGIDSLAHRIAVNEIACKGEVYAKASGRMPRVGSKRGLM